MSSQKAEPSKGDFSAKGDERRQFKRRGGRKTQGLAGGRGAGGMIKKKHWGLMVEERRVSLEKEKQNERKKN